MKISAIITTYKEPLTVKKAIESIVASNSDSLRALQLIIVAPDKQTITSAQEVLSEFKKNLNWNNFLVIKDSANGKPAALNLAYKHCTGDLILMTDGDVYLDKDAIKEFTSYFENVNNEDIVAATGHPVSIDDRNKFFGYLSHLFCEAAHQKRLLETFVPMSGYLYALKKSVADQIFPLDETLRAEDAFISSKVISLNFKIAYLANALVYVKFPKNLNDWIKQKTRSLGGNVQLHKFSIHEGRNIMQDLKMALFPLYFANTPREFLYSLMLYPLRLYLWIRIYEADFFNRYSQGAWDRIESSK